MYPFPHYEQLIAIALTATPACCAREKGSIQNIQRVIS